jgi:hypothetical protein
LRVKPAFVIFCPVKQQICDRQIQITDRQTHLKTQKLTIFNCKTIYRRNSRSGCKQISTQIFKWNIIKNQMSIFNVNERLINMMEQPKLNIVLG